MKENDAALCLRLIPKVNGDLKSVAKRLADDAGTWPREIRDFMLYLRELEQTIEEKHPLNIK